MDPYGPVYHLYCFYMMNALFLHCFYLILNGFIHDFKDCGRIFKLILHIFITFVEVFKDHCSSHPAQQFASMRNLFSTNLEST